MDRPMTRLLLLALATALMAALEWQSDHLSVIMGVLYGVPASAAAWGVAEAYYRYRERRW